MTNKRQMRFEMDKLPHAQMRLLAELHNQKLPEYVEEAVYQRIQRDSEKFGLSTEHLENFLKPEKEETELLQQTV